MKVYLNMPKDELLVSVVMPVYNAELYVEEAIESIIGQTFKGWELIVVDDASTDGSLALVKKIADNDSRIRVIALPNNVGHQRARNKGIMEVRGKYYAVQDADDISLPVRLEKQVAFMEANPKIAIVGSHIQIMDEDGCVYAMRHYPESAAAVKKSAILFNPFAASAAMVKADVLKRLGGYPLHTKKIAEDYALWLKILSECEGVNIPLFLIKYRLFQSGDKNTVRQKLINNIRVKRVWVLHKQYFSFMGLVRFILENILILLPQRFVLMLFKRWTLKPIVMRQ